MTPADVLPNSEKKFWWKCEKEHEWEASPDIRFDGSGCPFCANRKILIGYNDLVTRNPKLANEWHPTKNGELTPIMIIAGSPKKVWWLGKCGHEWQANINMRDSGSGCPVCLNRQVLKGFNDLATVNPELSREWHPTKNGDLTPEMIIAGSPKKVWWLGKCGHEWEAVLQSRNNGVGCPICAGQQLLSGYNDFATKFPELVKEWNAIRNDGLTPDLVSPYTSKKVWWTCKYGHEYQSSVASKSNGTGCPVCSNRQVLAGFNDLATKNAGLTKEWHPFQNGELTPNDVTPGSGKKVWWKCENGHEWEASTVNRTKGRGCPYCPRKRTSITNSLDI